MAPPIDKSTITERNSRRKNARGDFFTSLSRLKGLRNFCRIFLIGSMVIAYISSYFLLSSNSDYTIRPEEVVHVDRHKNDNATTTHSLHKLHLLEIQNEAFKMSREYKPTHPSTWCIDSRLKLNQHPLSPMGLCYLRIPHSAGGTLKGINMRIARNFARRYDSETCIRHDSSAIGMNYAQRNELSYLWTFVRDPTDRAMSVVGSTLSRKVLGPQSRDLFTRAQDVVQASHNETEAQTSNNALVNMTLELLRNAKDIRNGVVSEGRGGFQLQFGMQKYIDINSVIRPDNPTVIVDRSLLFDVVSDMFRRYDFVGVVERFDESLVVMQLLLGLETSDILYFAVNRKEQWRRAKIGPKRHVCRKQFNWEIDLLTETSIRDYLWTSKEWFARNYGDYLLHQAASQSLDRTILKIGLDVFSKELKKFRSLMKRAHEECSPVFPCSLNGTDQFKEAQNDCLADGLIGCGYRCLDGLAA